MSIALRIEASNTRTLRKALPKQNGVTTVDKKSVEEIEKELGLDKVRPISLSSDDERDVRIKGDCFAQWYEEESRELYEQD
jgi:2-polyprenyl-6-methoxyphenol hydroxylase-like FAD-dependent oxidoreductase